MSVPTDTKTKRVRTSNWDDQEKTLLRRLAAKKIHIIENKDTSSNTNNAKKLAWQEIGDEFNQLNSKAPRQIPNIQSQWRSIKNSTKIRESLLRPSYDLPPDDIEFIEAIPNEFAVDSNIYDSDATYRKKIDKTEPSLEQRKEKILKIVKRKFNEKISINYEEKVYEMTKEAKQREMKRAEELHMRKMKILELEQTYWELKIVKLEKEIN